MAHPVQLTARPRRLRLNASVRGIAQESFLHVEQLAQPIFLVEGSRKKEEIPSMPGIFRYSLDLALPYIDELAQFGIRTLLLFPVVDPSQKDALGSISRDKDFFFFDAIRTIKKTFPALLLATDIALDPYTTHGHDGILGEDGYVLNDETLPLLSAMAIEQAKAGADMVAPSDMMDGRVGYIRRELDAQNFTSTLILAYTAKYASSFYGPFRDCLQSNLQKGSDKKTYQMNPTNINEAIREARFDIAEGADIIMVKPGLPYLDVVRMLSDRFDVPVAVYHVSGEYAALKAAEKLGWLSYEAAMMEQLTAFSRAKASLIITYAALDAAKILAGDHYARSHSK